MQLGSLCETARDPNFRMNVKTIEPRAAVPPPVAALVQPAEAHTFEPLRKLHKSFSEKMMSPAARQKDRAT